MKDPACAWQYVDSRSSVFRNVIETGVISSCACVVSKDGDFRCRKAVDSTTDPAYRIRTGRAAERSNGGGRRRGLLVRRGGGDAFVGTGPGVLRGTT